MLTQQQAANISTVQQSAKRQKTIREVKEDETKRLSLRVRLGIHLKRALREQCTFQI